HMTYLNNHAGSSHQTCSNTRGCPENVFCVFIPVLARENPVTFVQHPPQQNFSESISAKRCPIRFKPGTVIEGTTITYSCKFQPVMLQWAAKRCVSGFFWPILAFLADYK